MEVGLSRGDIFCQSKWIIDVSLIAIRLSQIRPLSHVGDNTGFFH